MGHTILRKKSKFEIASVHLQNCTSSRSSLISLGPVSPHQLIQWVEPSQLSLHLLQISTHPSDPVHSTQTHKWAGSISGLRPNHQSVCWTKKPTPFIRISKQSPSRFSPPLPTAMAGIATSFNFNSILTRPGPARLTNHHSSSNSEHFGFHFHCRSCSSSFRRPFSVVARYGGGGGRGGRYGNSRRDESDGDEALLDMSSIRSFFVTISVAVLLPRS